MNKKKLGGTSELVSEFCLGTMYFGTSVDEASAFEILDAFVANGGNFIDTANNYCFWNGIGNGNESEELLGRWIKSRNNRNDIILASKVGARPITPFNGFEDQNFRMEGLRKETILKAADDSLRRLGTDYLDLYYMHIDVESDPLEERLEALYLLEKAGKIRFNACSNINEERIVESEALSATNKQTGYQAIQQKYSYLVPTDIDPNQSLKFVDDALIRFAENNEMSILTYSALLSGAYSKGYDTLPDNYKSDGNKALFDALENEVKRIGCTPSQYVLLWLKNKSKQIIPLIAASRLSQLEENINSLNYTL